MFKKIIFAVLFFLFLPDKVFAADNSFVTIVNPVRISSYIEHPEKSLAAEYEEIKKRNLPATWLLTFDALRNKEVMKVIESFDEKQELGVFLEVTSDFADSAKVTYNLSDSWHRAKSLFLSGYLQPDRIKLMDHVFESFKKEFGYYPVSVGSWWTDSFSLEYLSKKYKVTSNLSVSDQLALDEYTVWGTYYSTPYYPSKINAGNPAVHTSTKIDIVMLRWAPRDPMNGFESPSHEKSAMYSAQDYDSIKLPDSYFEKLSAFYATRAPHNDFAHLTIGLEADLREEAYGTQFAKRVETISNLDVEFLNMKEFSNWYRQKYKQVSPPQLLVADDFLGTSKKAVWYQNPNYRIGMVHDPSAKELTVVDLRPFYPDFVEPFYKSPNRQDGLYIVLPYIIDQVLEPGSARRMTCGNYISADKNRIKFEGCDIEFGSFVVKLNGKDITPQFSTPYSVGPNGDVRETIGFKVPFGLVRRIPVSLLEVLPFAVFIFLILSGYALFKSSKEKKIKYTIIFIVVILLAFLASYKKLHISQSEIEALKFLYKQEKGKVLTFNKDCLNCTFQTANEPAAASGYRKYISRATDKEVFESLNLPLAKTPEDIKNELNRTGAEYVYLLKYEDYIEQLAFPAENVGLKKIFENANATILKVVE